MKNKEVKKEIDKLEDLADRYVVGQDAAINRLQKMVRHLIEICKIQQELIENGKTKEDTNSKG